MFHEEQDTTTPTAELIKNFLLSQVVICLSSNVARFDPSVSWLGVVEPCRDLVQVSAKIRTLMPI